MRETNNKQQIKCLQNYIGTKKNDVRGEVESMKQINIYLQDVFILFNGV